mgnify:CR=1 FL=1
MFELLLRLKPITKLINKGDECKNPSEHRKDHQDLAHEHPRKKKFQQFHGASGCPLARPPGAAGLPEFPVSLSCLPAGPAADAPAAGRSNETARSKFAAYLRQQRSKRRRAQAPSRGLVSLLPTTTRHPSPESPFSTSGSPRRGGR